MQIKTPNLAPLIDYTCLKADATLAEIELLCSEAIKCGFATVCVNSYWLRTVSKLLTGSSVKPITVVGFPLGANLMSVKAFETREAIAAGAQEIDMVLNIGALKSGDENSVLEDIKVVVDAAKPYPVKVILETALLTNLEKVKACELAKQAGAQFVKTSTGFSTNGATVEDVKIMRETVGARMGVKASGGIKTTEEGLALVNAGANRLGTSRKI
ncbi:MAG: deoxyribose-phosphate aldolase [Myxococcaceae bacterium]